jgi:hypothetical protein
MALFIEVGENCKSSAYGGSSRGGVLPTTNELVVCTLFATWSRWGCSGGGYRRSSPLVAMAMDKWCARFALA